MQLVMLKYDEEQPGIDLVFLEFAKASCRAQELELLLKVNLQYSLALAGLFEDVKASDDSARDHQVISMGRVFTELAPYIDDDPLRSMIGRAIDTRNTLVHHFFARSQAGIKLTEKEAAKAIKWCTAATAEFTALCRKLEERWGSLAVQLSATGYQKVPGMRERVDAIERGEWS